MENIPLPRSLPPSFFMLVSSSFNGGCAVSALDDKALITAVKTGRRPWLFLICSLLTSFLEVRLGMWPGMTVLTVVN